MGTFQITGPNGKKYRVTGDDPAGAVNALKKMLGADTTAPVNPATNQPGDVPAFVPPGVEGYDPQTGEVQKYSGVGSAGMGAADMTTFGFGDEIGAALGTGIDMLPGGKGASFSQNLAEIRGNQGQAQRENPNSYLAGQVAGGVAQGVAAGPSIMANAPSLIGRVAGGSMTGAGFGGLYGLGSGEGVSDRLYEGGKDALIGAAAGGAFPVLATGASKAYSSVADALLGRNAARQAGTSPKVLRMLGNVLDADGTRGPVGQANMARAGADAMLADAGPNAKAILDTSIQRGGPGGVAARDAITARTGRAATAVGDALDNTLGAPQGVTAARTAILTGSAAARGNAYDDAYKAAIDYADEGGRKLEGLIKGRVPGRVIADANELMRLGGDESSQILAKVADDGSVAFEKLPDVRQIDYITRALNQAAESGDGAGALGGQTPKGRAYAGLSREIRDTLRDLVPEYGKALETAADPIRRSKAIELGSKLFSPSTTRDQIDEAVRGMTGPEKEAVAQGVRSRLDDAMANVTRTIQDGDTPAREAIKAIKDLSSRANREKLEAVIGKTKADALFSEVDRATTSFDLKASVAENSKTYARQATERRVGEMTDPIEVDTLTQATQRIVKAMFGQTRGNAVRKQDAIYSEIARLLTRPAGQSQATFNAIDQLGQSDQATKLMADRIARALSGPRLAYPTTGLLADRLQEWTGR